MHDPKRKHFLLTVTVPFAFIQDSDCSSHFLTYYLQTTREGTEHLCVRRGGTGSCGRQGPVEKLPPASTWEANLNQGGRGKEVEVGGEHHEQVVSRSWH